MFVQGGFLEVQPTRVTVLADTAIRAARSRRGQGAGSEGEGEGSAGEQGFGGSVAAAQAELATMAAQIAAIRKLKPRS